MNTQETILQLEGLKLKGMAECYKALQSMPASQWPALDTFIARLAETERQYRNRKRTEMYLKTSKLRYNAVMEDVICSEERNLGKEMLIPDDSRPPELELQRYQYFFLMLSPRSSKRRDLCTSLSRQVSASISLLKTPYQSATASWLEIMSDFLWYLSSMICSKSFCC